jgi:hypothetical protein
MLLLIVAFFLLGFQNVEDLLKSVCSLDDEVTEVQPTDADGKKVVRRSLTRTRTSVGAYWAKQTNDRHDDTIELILNKDSQQC